RAKRSENREGRRLSLERMTIDLKRDHPSFRGNWDDLCEFMKLANSPIRSKQREDALRDWEAYKIRRQLSQMPGRILKGTYMRAVVSRVIDLSGGKFDEVILGYADLRG